MNSDLKSLFESDAADHKDPSVAGSEEYAAMRNRDSQRRIKVRAILESGCELGPVDLFHAAWVLNHGDDETDAELAHRLAEQSLNAGHEPAKWLFAATLDRWHMYRGEPQKFGTQIVPDGQRYRVWETTPDATDDERKRYNVPPLDEMHARAAAESKSLQQPPMEFAPKWLVDAIARWRAEIDE